MASNPTRPTRDVTRDDVARLAGVSSAVVSYVVNNGPRPVADATRRRVQEAIEKLGYRPNAAARVLTTGRPQLLSLIVPDLKNPYFSALAEAVEAAAKEQGLGLVLAQAQSEDLPELVESLSGRLVAGIITATLPTADIAQILVRNRVPMVKLSLALPLDPMPSIWPDYYGGTRAAVDHLIGVHGHRQLALITGSEQRDERELAWHDSLREAGLDTSHIIRTSWSAHGGFEAAGTLLAEHGGATAAFVTSDQQAIGVIAGLYHAGRSVPTDMALTSFDGSPDAEFTIPPLTTVNVPLADMAVDAVAEILGVANHGRTYATSLVVRRSCGCGPA
ncbi:MAG TPA: LacI family DNA-binding transcriptional regulator [Propionicimonas sp.]|nr:LacI family DNA-binding transcriptional regulator [Propionicimonas sp.]